MAAPWRDRAGLTLLEVLLAFSVLALVVVLLAGSLRVGVRAWEAGDRQAALQQETRVIVELVTEALSAAYPYRDRLGLAPQRVVLFQGEPDTIRFVTTAPPLLLDPSDLPYHAVVVRLVDNELRLSERLVPTEEPFRDGEPTVLSRSVTALRLQYLDESGAWQDRWEAAELGGLPRAVRVELGLRARGRDRLLPAFVVPIPLGKNTA